MINPIATSPSIQVDPKTLTALSALGLKCIDCCGGSRSEVRNCELEDCALWSFRMAGMRAAAKRVPEIKMHSGTKNPAFLNNEEEDGQ